MGTGAQGGGLRRARRQLGRAVTALAGAAAMGAAAVIGRLRRHRPHDAIAPSDAVAGPPPAPRGTETP